jgi:hypothetical protein
MTSTQTSRIRDHVLGELFGILVAGLLVAFLLGVVQTTSRWSSALFAIAVAMASAAVGGLFGLLFGIPRALTLSPPPGTPPATTPAASSDGSQDSTTETQEGSVGGYSANTNLEQVSDWLTKLLLGAGLTQIARVPSALKSVGSYLSPEIGGSGSASIATTIVVLNLLTGFFFGFLAARLSLGKQFYRADQEARGVLEVTRALKASTSLPSSDPGKFPTPDTNPTPQDKLNARILARRVERIENTTIGPAFDAESYQRLAGSLVAAKLYERSLSILELGMSELKTDPSLPLYAGTICGMYTGDFEQAKQYYFKALSISPEYAMAYYNLACTAARESQLEGADVQTKLNQAKELLRQAFALDGSLAQKVLGDPLWTQINFHGDRELAELVGQTAS